MALQTENRCEYDFAYGASDKASEGQIEKSLLTKHGLLGELYELTLKIGHSVMGARAFNKRCSSILGEGLAQLSLWREYFPDTTVSELPKNNEYSQLDRSALKLLFEAGKTVQTLANGLQYSTKVLPSDWQRFCAVTDRAEYLVGSSDDPDPRSDDEYSSEASDSGAATVSSIRELVDLFSTHIRCLMRLGPTIQDAFNEEAHHQDETPAHRDQSFKLHGPSAYYVSLILHQFKNPDRDLADKLGEANWQRSERVRWTPLGGPVSMSKLTELIGVTPSSVFAPTTAFRDSGLGSSIPASTQYAASLVTNITAQVGNAARVPPTPAEVKHKKPFECWICKTRISHVKDRHQWKMHVFADLQPYICCVSSCRHLLTFPTRDQWLDHTFHQHKAADVFRCELNGQDERKTQCPLCQSSIGATRHEYGKHLGRHLESIALASLPKDVDSENELSSGSASDAGSDVLADKQTDHSTLSEFKLETHPSRERTFDDATFDGQLLAKEKLEKWPAPANQTSISDAVDERFRCRRCGKAFVKQLYLNRHHRAKHADAKNLICHGPISLLSSGSWGCGRAFAHASALRRHFRSKTGRACVKPLLEEAAKQPAASGKGNTENTIPPIPSFLAVEYPELAALVDHSSIHEPLYNNRELKERQSQEAAPIATHSSVSRHGQSNTNNELPGIERIRRLTRPEQITFNNFPLLGAENIKMHRIRFEGLWRIIMRATIGSLKFENGLDLLESANSKFIREYEDLCSSNQMLSTQEKDLSKAQYLNPTEGSGPMAAGGGALADYQMQLMLLERQKNDIIRAKEYGDVKDTVEPQRRPQSSEQIDEESSNPTIPTSQSGHSGYWTTQATKHYEDLLTTHGSDWAAIVEQLSAEKASMDKNYYQTSTDKNDRLKLQDIVYEADLRKGRTISKKEPESRRKLAGETSQTANDLGVSERQGLTMKKDVKQEQVVLKTPLNTLGNVCYTCGEVGHIARSCPQNIAVLEAPLNAVAKVCYKCGKAGHWAIHCPQKIAANHSSEGAISSQTHLPHKSDDKGDIPGEARLVLPAPSRRDRNDSAKAQTRTWSELLIDAESSDADSLDETERDEPGIVK